MTNLSGQFAVHRDPATVTFVWYAPIPSIVTIKRHDSVRGWWPVYEGAPPARLNLLGGYGPTRLYHIATTPPRVPYAVQVSGPSHVRVW